jgi:hypothetical protein
VLFCKRLVIQNIVEVEGNQQGIPGRSSAEAGILIIPAAINDMSYCIFIGIVTLQSDFLLPVPGVRDAVFFIPFR